MPKGYHHLTKEQRCQLYLLKKRGISNSCIAQELGVHRSNIYRELKRNSGQRGYRYQQADDKAVERRQNNHTKKKKMSGAFKNALEGEFYFAKPYYSWQRGLNEHAKVEEFLNNRPRKMLEFKTPALSSLKRRFQKPKC